MLLSLFFSVALAGLVTVGSIPPLASSDYVTNDVDMVLISCTPLNGASGTLAMTSFQPILQYPLAIVGNTLELDQINIKQQFIFENCTSTYMDITNTSPGYYWYG